MAQIRWHRTLVSAEAKRDQAALARGPGGGHCLGSRRVIKVDAVFAIADHLAARSIMGILRVSSAGISSKVTSKYSAIGPHAQSET